MKEGAQDTYGQYLEKQIAEVLRMYENEGLNTNQAFNTIGNMESITLPNPPCLRMIDSRVKDNKLHFSIDFRSWDLWAGFPSNFATFQRLKELISG